MRRLFSGAAAALGWFAVILQLILILGRQDGLSAGAHIVNFFSYFTILSNVMSALMLTASSANWRGPLARSAVQTAITVYMTVTGLVYTFILADLWAPTGWQFVADSLLHYVMPAVVVVFWFFLVTKGTLRLGHLAWFLVFPLAYVLYSLIRGPIAEWYPYPFLDVALHGTSAVLLNALAMAVGFVLVGLLYMWLDRVLGGRRIEQRA